MPSGLRARSSMALMRGPRAFYRAGMRLRPGPAVCAVRCPQEARTDNRPKLPPRPGVPGRRPRQRGKPAPDLHRRRGQGHHGRRLRGPAGAGQSVGELVRAVRQGIADARPARDAQTKAVAGHRGQPGQRAATLGRRFLAKLKIADLGALSRSGMRLSGALDAQVLPTSILYDAAGNEVWRYIGDLDWTGAEAAKLLAEAGAPRQQAEQPAVDDREADRDQREAAEILRRRDLRRARSRRAGSRSAGRAG